MGLKAGEFLMKVELIWLQVAFDKWWSRKFCDENVLQRFNTKPK